MNSVEQAKRKSALSRQRREIEDLYMQLSKIGDQLSGLGYLFGTLDSDALENEPPGKEATRGWSETLFRLGNECRSIAQVVGELPFLE